MLSMAVYSVFGHASRSTLFENSCPGKLSKEARHARENQFLRGIFECVEIWYSKIKSLGQRAMIFSRSQVPGST